MQSEDLKSQLGDQEIRIALRDKLRVIHADELDTAIIDELSLCQGDARVDVAVVNGSFSGYEIKSDRDTLNRLPNQLAAYELCFDTMTIVVGGRYLAKCKKAIPDWWGIWEATPTEKGIQFGCWREPTPNHRISSERVVQLLWKQELREALTRFGINAPVKTSRRELGMRLIAAAGDDVFAIVRSRIRARGDWRSAPTPFRCGGLSRSAATSPRCQKNRDWLLSVVSQRRHR
jgi:hypothetical protein